MNRRERVWKALNHQVPDRVPLDFGSRISGLALASYENLKKRFGIEIPTQVLDKRTGLALVDESILDRFDIDTRYIYLKPSRSWNPMIRPMEDTFVDEWGATLKRPKDGFYYDHVEYPIKEPTKEAIQKHHWPNPDDPTRLEGLKEEARAFYEKGYALGTVIKGVFETTCILRGFEQVLSDIALNQDFYHALADKTADVLSRMVEHLLSEVGSYLQFVCVTCDLATQLNLMISPDHYKIFVKPYEKRIFEVVKRKSRAKVAQHSCGAVFRLIPELIDSGIQILNPIQTSAKGMDTKLLKREYGQDLCFWGGIDVQKILPCGTPGEVEREVKRVIDDLAAGGGVLLGPSHDIQAFTPVENIVALFQSAVKYGLYPHM